MMMKMIVKGSLHPIAALPRLRQDHVPNMAGVILAKVIACLIPVLLLLLWLWLLLLLLPLLLLLLLLQQLLLVILIVYYTACSC